MRHLKLNINIEDAKSRIPGLFPCYEYENGVFSLHNALDFEDGCYNKIVENIKLPNNVHLTILNEKILKEGEVYTYKTLLKYYNMYKDKIDDPFICFFNRGIGLVYSDRDVIASFAKNEDEKAKIKDKKVTDLIPKFVYLSNVKTLYKKLNNNRKLCIQGIDCDIYERMGGDCMLEYFKYLFSIAERFSKEIYNSAKDNINELNSVSVQGNLQLFTTIDDIGIYETILEEWQPGVEYHKGNIVTYEYETWICTDTTSGIYDEESGFYSFDYENFKKVNEKYDLSDGDTLVGYTDSKLKNLRSYKDYVNEIYEIETPDKSEDWLFYYKIGNVSNLEVTTDELGNIMTLDDNINREPFKYIPKINGLSYQVALGITNKNPKILMSQKLPIADENSPEQVLSLENQEEQGSHTLWALYEKENTYSYNLMAYGDVIDDISYDSKNYTITIEYTTGAHLKAKLRAIKRNFDNKEIFYYYPFEHDEKDNRGIKYIETYSYEKNGEIDKIIKNGDFEEFFKNDRNILIKYMNEYIIDGINLEKVNFNDVPTKKLTKYILLNNEFYMWDEGIMTIRPSYIKINVIQNNYSYNKFRFDVSKNLKSKDIEVNNRVISTDYIESKFETKLDENKDTFFNPITKIDYLVGNTFNPIIEHNININRGNAASWERHIKLGEVKTLQDLEQYGNDYFNIERQ